MITPVTLSRPCINKQEIYGLKTLSVQKRPIGEKES